MSSSCLPGFCNYSHYPVGLRWLYHRHYPYLAKFWHIYASSERLVWDGSQGPKKLCVTVPARCQSFFGWLAQRSHKITERWPTRPGFRYYWQCLLGQLVTVSFCWQCSRLWISSFHTILVTTLALMFMTARIFQGERSSKRACVLL